jgi:phage terminase small subunit
VKLTLKQRAFANYYIELGNATEAYKKAYPNITKQRTAESAGNRLLSNVEVKKYIDEKMKEIESSRIAKAEEVLEYLTKVLRDEEVEQVVILKNIGDFLTEPEIVEKKLSAKDRIKAAELLGKRYRLFTDKVEADINQVVIFGGEDELED